MLLKITHNQLLIILSSFFFIVGVDIIRGRYDDWVLPLLSVPQTAHSAYVLFLILDSFTCLLYVAFICYLLYIISVIHITACVTFAIASGAWLIYAAQHTSRLILFHKDFSANYKYLNTVLGNPYHQESHEFRWTIITLAFFGFLGWNRWKKRKTNLIT